MLKSPDKFFAAIRPLFAGGWLSASQVAGMEGLIKAFDQVGDRDLDKLAYGLATVFHETGQRMVPVREGFATSNAGARAAVDKLAAKRGPNSAVAKYAMPAGPYGHVYYGRGHVQLTWLDNYKKASAAAGVDLVKNPDLMLDPVISGRVLFVGLISGQWGGGKGISAYEGADDFLSDEEAIKARALVNGTDEARKIAGYHRRFYNALKEGRWMPASAGPVSVAAKGQGGLLARTLRWLGVWK